MATNFLHSPSTAANGFLVTPFSVIGASSTSTTVGTLANIANAAGVVSTAAYNQTNTGNAQYGYFYLVTGSSSTWQPTAGGNLTGWFLNSPDGGATYISTLLLPPAAPPDFIIPIAASTSQALPAQAICGWSSLVPLPYSTFEVYLQNNSGATSPTVSSVIKCAPVADQY